MLMQGKVVIVTAAGGGIGREIALGMAWAGAKVVVNDAVENNAGILHDAIFQHPGQHADGAGACRQARADDARKERAPCRVPGQRRGTRRSASCIMTAVGHPEQVDGHGMAALRAAFVPLDQSADVFSWEPV